MYFDDLKLNMSVTTSSVVIDKDEMLAFARRYDNCSIHTDEEYAKGTHFGRIIAPGIMSYMAVWAEYLKNDFFGDELLAGKSAKIEWYKPVFAGDTLYGKAVITNLTPRNPKNGAVELKIDVYNQNDELVLTSVNEAVVKRKPEK